MGKDMVKVPCFKETLMNSIGATAIVGVVYNFATSRNPGKICAVVYPVSFFGTW